VTNIRIDPSRQHEFLDLYYQRQKERVREPGAITVAIALPTPMDHVPGELWFHDLDQSFIDMLRSKGFPFTLF
jgi:hypothetical protein